MFLFILRRKTLAAPSIKIQSKFRLADYLCHTRRFTFNRNDYFI